MSIFASPITASGPWRGPYAAIANYSDLPPASNYMAGTVVYAPDLGSALVSNGTVWIPEGRQLRLGIPALQHLIVGGNGGTYSQTDTTITVTWASHGLTAWLNGAATHLTISTGDAVTGWFSNFQYVDANTFTVTSSVSQSASGDLGTNTALTYLPTLYNVPTELLNRLGNSVSLSAQFRAKNSGNTKTVRVYIGSLEVATPTTTTSSAIQNVGPSGIFIGDNLLNFLGFGAVATITDGNMRLSGQLANAGDWIMVCPTQCSMTFNGV